MYRKAIFSDIRLYNRKAEILYSSQSDKGMPGEVMRKVLFGSWEKTEKDMLKDTIKQIKEHVNNRETSTEELELLERELKMLSKPIKKKERVR